MSDETYSLIAALTAIAYAVVLWLKFRQGRRMRRLLDSLSEEQRQKIREILREKDDSNESH